jgi:chitinase
MKLIVLLISLLQIANAEYIRMYYWGQNSVYVLNPNDPSKWEQRLSYYCDLDWLTHITLAFVNRFGLDTSISINHAYHCSGECPQVASDIKYCQQKGKKVGLSLGGSIGYYGFYNDTQATDFAFDIWNTFLEGSGSYRPYSDAVFDYIDFDIENKNSIGYSKLSEALVNIFRNNSQKDYFLTATPQCVYPDASIGPDENKLLPTDNTLSNNIRYVSVQFYNNYCGMDNLFNYMTWHNWANQGGSTKLLVGFPAHQSAAQTGFLHPYYLQDTLKQVMNLNSFGGIMSWDVGFANINEFGSQVNKILNNEDVAPPITTTSSTTGCPTNTMTTTSTNTNTKTSTSTITMTSTSTSTSMTTVTKTVKTHHPAPTCTGSGILIVRGVLSKWGAGTACQRYTRSLVTVNENNFLDIKNILFNCHGDSFGWTAGKIGSDNNKCFAMNTSSNIFDVDIPVPCTKRYVAICN